MGTSIKNLIRKTAYRVQWFAEDLVAKLEAEERATKSSSYPSIEDTPFDLDAYIRDTFAEHPQREMVDKLEHKYGTTTFGNTEVI